MVTQAEVDAQLAKDAEEGEEPEDKHPDEVIGNDVEEEEEDEERTDDDVDSELGNIAGIPIGTVGTTKRYINSLIYAESGTGKTVLCGSADVVPEMAPILLIDIEGGTLSLEDFYPNVHVVRVETWSALQKIYDKLYSGESGYQTVVVDSLTEAQKFSMQEIMKKSRREDPTIDPDVPRMRDWGKNIEQMRRFVRGMRDLPMNVIFTALAAQDKDDSTGKLQVRPSFNGKVGGEIPAFMDTVFYMYIKEFNGVQQRLLLTKKTDRYLAKDRSNKLPPVIEDPTMELVYGYMTGKITPPEPEPKEEKKARAKGSKRTASKTTSK